MCSRDRSGFGVKLLNGRIESFTTYSGPFAVLVARLIWVECVAEPLRALAARVLVRLGQQICDADIDAGDPHLGVELIVGGVERYLGAPTMVPVVVGLGGDNARCSTPGARRFLMRSGAQHCHQRPKPSPNPVRQ
jgi:hypothetical protein